MPDDEQHDCIGTGCQHPCHRPNENAFPVGLSLEDFRVLKRIAAALEKLAEVSEQHFELDRRRDVLGRR